MSIEQISHDSQDPDDIGDFLAEEGLDWSRIQQVADGYYQHPEAFIEGPDEDPDDIGDFLGEQGLNWDEISRMDFASLDEGKGIADENIEAAIANATAEAVVTGDTSNDYHRDNAIPVISGEAIYEALKTAEIPDISPLALKDEQQRKLNIPLKCAKDVHDMRGLIKQIVYDNIDTLNLDENTFHDMLVAVSEALTNGIRHGNGVSRIILGSTPYRNLFVGIENTILDNPEDFPYYQNARTEQRIGNAALGLGIEDSELTDDLHNRGLLLLAALSVNGIQAANFSGLKKNRTISAGISSLPMATIFKLSRHEQLQDDDFTVHGRPRRTFVWGAFGRDTEAARIADEALAQVA